MDYVLYVPGMPFTGGTIAAGLSLGGSESAGYYLARELARRGHRVTVFSQIAAAQAGRWDGVAYRPIGPATEAAPFGEAFEAYVAAVPCDVLIGQRAPGLFHRPTAAKVQLWWSHDLALRRHLPAFGRQLWNLNGVLCVSEWHRAQVAEVYGLPPERIAVVPNGVDPALFPHLAPAGTEAAGGGPGAAAKRRSKRLVYSSRPERGLVHLLGGLDGAGDGPGILARLAAEDPEIRLVVCGYDNTTPELAGFYAALRERCRALPNAEWLGPLSKGALAALMSEAWLHVYPTTFEETSCITAMEAQCAGTPVVASPVGALPETLRDAGALWVPLRPGGPNPDGGGADADTAGSGAVDRDGFVRAILNLRDDPARYDRLHALALARARAGRYGWGRAADAVEAVVEDCLARQSAEPGRLARHLLRHSDIPALEAHLAAQGTRSTRTPAAGAGDAASPIVERVRAELTECYAFARAAPTEDPAAVARRLAAHYAAYYDHEAASGVTYGPEELAGQPRFEAVARRLAALPPGARVLDYGCAHGHYTVNLARRFPHLRFLGVDLVPRNIDTARAWAAAEGLREGIDWEGDGQQDKEAVTAAAPIETPAARAPQERGADSRAHDGNSGATGAPDAPGRVVFRVGSVESGVLRPGERFACVLAAEVLEHVPDPAALADALAAHLEPGGRMVVTTPYGPWEAQGFAAHHPWRAHLHHLERADLEALFGHHPDFACEPVPAGATAWGEALGSWLSTWRTPQAASAAAPTPARGRIDLPAKLRRQRPRETLSVCMVVAPQGETLGRCLASVASIADEIVLGIDAGHRPTGPAGPAGHDGPVRTRPPQGGRAWELAEAHGAAAFALASPLETGFAAARNATLERAHGDWVLWIDDDEELLWPERLPKYLRDNLYDAYALAQHHFAVEPGGVIKTDYPCRLIRRGRGFAFHGIVHEHPERGFNGGAGAVLLLPDVAICHNGYLTEDVRRRRFARNLPLMQRDRAAHPQRILGRFLWIRDLAHLNCFEAERTGGVSAGMRARAEEAIALWRGLLAEGHTRLAVDALPYTSEAARLLAGPGAIDLQLGLALHRLGLGDAAGPAPAAAPPPIQGAFLAQADVEALTAALLQEKLGAVTGKYL